MAEQTEEKTIVQHLAVLKELSDIKSSLASNTTETSNIKNDVKEIRLDIKDIKNDFVSRREFTDGLETVRQELSPLKKFIYGLIAVVLLAFIGAVINLVLMK